MKVKEFLYLLPRQTIWKYELEFSGFTDKEEAEIASIIPKVVEDGRPLLKIVGKGYKRIIENYSTKEVSIEAFFCFIRKQTFY